MSPKSGGIVLWRMEDADDEKLCDIFGSSIKDFLFPGLGIVALPVSSVSGCKRLVQ
jgi:hypothetical protein